MEIEGDGEDFGAFVARAWPGLVRTAVLLTGDRTRGEDLAQEALVRTHRRWRSLRRSDAPEAYVRAAMVNLNRSWWRRRARREVLVDAAPDGAVRAGAWGTPVETDDVLAAALAGLPPRMRATLVLRFYEDLSEHQTAQLLGCAPGTVKSQTSRGLERLRDALVAAGHDSSPRPGAAAPPTDTTTGTSTDPGVPTSTPWSAR